MWLPRQLLSVIDVLYFTSSAAQQCSNYSETSGYATWFTAGGAICIAHYDVIDDVITRKL